MEDVIWGIGQPGGEGGYNIARVASILSGLNAPGVTVNRYCSSSLQTIRMAAHAIKAGEGDCFVAGGVETVSRYINGAADSGPHNESVRGRPRAAAEGAHRRGLRRRGNPPQGLPDIYIAMGQTAENVAQYKGVSRQAQDEWGVLLPEPGRGRVAAGASSSARSPPTPSDDGSEVQALDDGIRELARRWRACRS